MQTKAGQWHAVTAGTTPPEPPLRERRQPGGRSAGLDVPCFGRPGVGAGTRPRAPGAARRMHWAEAGRRWAACGAVGGGPPFPGRTATAPRRLFSAPGGLSTGLCNPFRTGVPSGVANLPCALRLSLTFARPLLARLESPRLRSGGGRVSDPGKPYRGKPRGVTSSSSVTSPAPRGVWGFPQRRLPRNCAGHRRGQGSRPGLQRAFTAPCVCPTGPARPRVRPARAPTGAMGRSGRRCCCPPPARAQLEPRRGQPPAAGPRVTLAAPGSVARARGHVEEPSVQ